MKIHKEYSTTDIVLASTLKVHNFNIIRIDILKNKGIFVFEDVPEQFIQDYDLGKIKVSPIEFNNNLKHLTTSVRRMLK